MAIWRVVGGAAPYGLAGVEKFVVSIVKKGVGRTAAGGAGQVYHPRKGIETAA